nr:MAG TPA: protein of unknown function (DUF1869) [Bacteriophage sp.]
MKILFSKKTEKNEVNFEFDTNNSSGVSVEKDVMSWIINFILWLTTVISIVKYLLIPLL